MFNSSSRQNQKNTGNQEPKKIVTSQKLVLMIIVTIMPLMDYLFVWILEQNPEYQLTREFQIRQVLSKPTQTVNMIVLSSSIIVLACIIFFLQAINGDYLHKEAFPDNFGLYLIIGVFGVISPVSIGVIVSVVLLTNQYYVYWPLLGFYLFLAWIQGFILFKSHAKEASKYLTQNYTPPMIQT